LAGLETTVGLFVNTPPFRVTIPQEGSLLSWLQTLQAGHARLRQFEYCSTGQIHQWSKLPAAFSLFESALVYENYPETHTEAAPEGSLLPHLQQFRGIGAQTRYAIALLAAVQQRLMFRMTYDRRRFDGEGGGRVLEHFLALLNRMATDAEGPISTLLAAAPTDQIPGFRLLLPPDRVERGEEAITAPRTPTETILADICAEVLGLERVGIDENLLELGAHSLLLTQVVSRIRSALKTELPLSAVFDAPSVAGIARILHARQFAGEGAKPPALQPTSRDRTLPLSFAQQRLWLIDQLNPGQALYNTAAQIRLMGPLDRIALEAGFTEIVARHEVLRTVFATQDEEPIQVILPPQPVPLPYVDLRALPDEEKRREVQRLAEAEELKPFDLAHDRMLRVQLLGIEKEEHLLLLTLHHIASDRWSFEVLLQELKTLYEASVSGHLASLPALPIQYADYAVREREVLGDTVYASQLEYWRKQLAHIPSDPLLATDYPRPEKTTYPGEIHSARLAKAHSDALLALARQSGCSSYMLLLAAFHVLLGYRSEQTTIVTGANVANRTQVELEGLIGFFVNQIVLRSDLAGNPSFREYLGRVREMVLEGYAHQEVPFDMVVADQKRKRTLDLTPLFQVLFVQNTAIPPIRQSGLTILSPAFDPGISRFDLAVFTGETDEGTVFEWLYRTDLFSQATVARMADHLIALLEHLAANPEARISDLNAVLAERDGQQRRSENRARAELGKSLFKKVAVKAVSFEADP
ncbi:MAG TPA: condensation domain-containing protein, partial [Chthonomonadaceae bacterium]|nr:condensation domain-containing protein [Chthonomonadaceae bacterium]